MKEPKTREFRFEDTPIRFFRFKGKWAALAHDVATWLAYEYPQTLVKNIRGEWSAEFDEGLDYGVVKGQNLKDLKQLVVDLATSEADSSIGARAPSAMLLYKDGVYAALMRTGKPEGIQLRKWLRRDVFPALEQDGFYAVDRAIGGEVLDLEAEPLDSQLALRFQRERRLLLRLELEKQKLATETMFRVLSAAEPLGLDRDLWAHLIVMAAEIATGRNLSPSLCLAQPLKAEDWQSPTQIAERYGVSPQKVGRGKPQLLDHN